VNEPRRLNHSESRNRHCVVFVPCSLRGASQCTKGIRFIRNLSPTGRSSHRGSLSISVVRFYPPPNKRTPLKKRVLLELEELEKRLVPNNPGNPYQVNTNADDPNVNLPFPENTLRDAIGHALDAGGNVTITFAQNVSGVIQLQAELPAIDDPELNLTIAGNGKVVVQGSGPDAQTKYNVFTIGDYNTVTISDLSISQGYVNGDGGGIDNEGTLTLSDDTVDSSSASNGGDGGGIYNAAGAQLYLYGTRVNDNSAAHFGGIYNASGGTVEIMSGSAVYYNQAADAGGGVANMSGKVFITGGGETGTILYNSAALGGGIYENRGTVSVCGATIGSNTSNATVGGGGGGIYVLLGSLKLASANIDGNRSANGNGGGIYIFSGNVTLSGGTIQGNMSDNGNGGGIYNSAGTLTLKGGVTIGPSNSANNGGGLYLLGTSTTNFDGCTVSGNKLNNPMTGKGVGVAFENNATMNGLPVGLTDKDDPRGNPVKV
jgi:hypothetical protein